MTDLRDGTAQAVRSGSSERLYFIDMRVGDDGVDGETNLADGGFVTDAQGYIISR